MSIAHTVYVLRHARAGSRSRWDGTDDRMRPLTPRGQRQALEIAALLAPHVREVHSSPYLRCVETVTPLATLVGTDVVIDERLAEGNDWLEVLRRIEASTATMAICTHGDVLGDLAFRLNERGVAGPGSIEKGCVWSLTVADGAVIDGRHHPAPEI
jgi:8-oxo-dGTP diphosphatase